MKRIFRCPHAGNRRYYRKRRGMITLDYVLILGITFPVSVLLFYWLLIGLLAIYRFASLTIGWPYL